MQDVIRRVFSEQAMTVHPTARDYSLIGRDSRLASAPAIPSGHQRRHFRQQPHADALDLVGRQRVGALIQLRQPRHKRAQRIHAMPACRNAFDQRALGGAQAAFGGEPGPKRGEFRGGRQLAIPQQVHDLLERRALGQIVNIVPGITQAAGRPIDRAEPCRRHHDVPA